MKRFGVAIAIAGQLLTARSAETAAPVHSVDGSFVREWLLLGPFPSEDLDVDHLAASGGEVNARPKEGDSVTTKDGTRLVWTRFESPDDFMKLERAYGFRERVVAYAYCELESAREGESEVRLWADLVWDVAGRNTL